MVFKGINGLTAHELVLAHASTVAASKPSNSRSKVDFPASKLLSYEVVRCEVWNVVDYHAIFLHKL